MYIRFINKVRKILEAHSDSLDDLEPAMDEILKVVEEAYEKGMQDAGDY